MPKAQSHAKKSVAYVGDEGLYELWLEAIDQYIDAVENRKIHYNVFVEDFINSHTFHDSIDSSSRNEHQKNLGRIEIFLTTRRDLLDLYTRNSERSFESFRSCMKAFLVNDGSNTRSGKTDFCCMLSKETIDIITEAANDIPLFDTVVSAHEIELFFNSCSPSASGPLVSSHNGAVAYFLCQLNNSGIIGTYYQKAIAVNGLLKSSTRKKVLTQDDLSAALHKFCLQVNPLRGKIDDWVFAIKEVHFGTKLPK